MLHRLSLTAIILLSISSIALGQSKRLTSDGAFKRDVTLIEDGTALVYTLLEKPQLMTLMRLDLETGKAERLHPGAATNEFEAAFSADGRYVSFVRSQGNLSLKLVIRDRQQNQDAVFDPGGGFFGMHAPAFERAGNRVLFSIPEGGGQQLVWVDLAGKNKQPLTSSTGINNWPDFSPDGKRIVFGSSRDGDFEIYSMNADSSDVRRLTNSPGRDVRPRFSPDGKQIAFTSARDGNSEIYVMDADGGRLRNVTQHAEGDDFPAWHPDGRHLYSISERAGQFDIYRHDVPR